MKREMKDSGIPWIGEIPKEWEVARTKYFYSTHKHIAGSKSDAYERLALTMKGVVKRSKIDNTGLQPDNFDTYQILYERELVFKLIDLQNVSTSRVGLSPYTGLVSPAYIILKPHKNVVPEFGQYYFFSLWHREIFNHLGGDGVRSSLNVHDLLEVPHLILCCYEQRRIADFLDAKCAEIDALAADIQTEIDTLEQYKRSVITETVTKGLNPDAEMKDSGIPWIGEIPKEWNLERLQWHLREITHSNNPVRTRQILSLTNKLGVIPYEAKGDIGNKSKEDYSDYKLAYPDTIVVNSMNVIIGSVGISNYFGCVSPVYYVFAPKIGNSVRFLNYIFQTTGFQKELRCYANGILEIRLRVSSDKILKRVVAIPSVEEQKLIVSFLDAKCAEIDSTVAEKRKQLETLDAYKKSLIFEYVTGKKEVPTV